MNDFNLENEILVGDILKLDLKISRYQCGKDDNNNPIMLQENDSFIFLGFNKCIHRCNNDSCLGRFILESINMRKMITTCARYGKKVGLKLYKRYEFIKEEEFSMT